MPKLKNARHEQFAAAAAQDVPAPAELPPAPTPEVTVATTLGELEEARKIALAKGQAAAAVSATLAKAKIAGLSDSRVENETPRPVAFQGSLSDAARRIAFLLHLASNEAADESKR